VKRHAPAALRNRAPLLEVLRRVLPARGTVLELGSGTGEHAIFLARMLPALEWQPSDPDPEARASIEAWAAEAALPNLRGPLQYDVLLPIWHQRRFDAVLCVNVLHVAPPECGAALVRGASAVLPPGGPLVIYGPFAPAGAPLLGRLARLDRQLRDVDPALGVRAIEALADGAAGAGLALEEDAAMPEEGDRTLVFRKR
jgi:SAM-dependent methyltransferase